MMQPFDLWVDISLIFRKKVWDLEGKRANKLCKNTALCYKKNVVSISFVGLQNLVGREMSS